MSAKKKAIKVQRKLISAEPSYWKELDHRWKSEGFESRSEFIRFATDKLRPEQTPTQEISFI